MIRWPAPQPQWPELTREHLSQLVRQLQPTLLVIDSFAQGPEQELADLPALPGLQRLLIAREPLTAAQLAAADLPVITALPEADGYILNREPQELLPRPQARQWLRASAEQPLVVIAHNGDPFETTAFFQQMLRVLAEQPYQLRLASGLPCPRPEWQNLWLQHYPLSEWLRGVDLLIGGGGYNTVAECQAHGVRGLFCAFERPLDRQDLRIATLPHFSRWQAAAELQALVAKSLGQPPPEPAAPEQLQGATRAAALIAERLATMAVE